MDGFNVKITNEREFDDLIDELSDRKLAASFERVMPDLTRRVGEELHRRIVENINNGRSEWPPLSGATKIIKGSEQPLIDTGQLLRSIQLQIGADSVLVGIPDGMIREDGTEMDLVAAVMEDGTVFEVTPGVRGFFAGHGIPLRKETRFIVVPPRPFFEPAVKAVEDLLPALIEEEMKKVIE